MIINCYFIYYVDTFTYRHTPERTLSLSPHLPASSNQLLHQLSCSCRIIESAVARNSAIWWARFLLLSKQTILSYDVFVFTTITTPKSSPSVVIDI